MIEKWEKEMADIKDQLQGPKVMQASDQLKLIKDQVLAQKERLISLPEETAREK